MHEFESFGKWLRHQRRALDLTQEELARQVGCAPITIRKLEGDEMRPSKQLAESLASPLGISLDQRESFVRFARTEARDALNNQFAAFEHISPAKESEVQLPSGTVHLLFSDIGSSTQLVQRLGEEYVQILGEHQRILRNTFTKWNGYEVNTHGDSFFAVFSRAIDAISAAIEAQQVLAKAKWAMAVPLQIRIGIHTGEPMLVNQDYVGVDVHRAARICAAAYPGQVLFSNETRVIVERQLPHDVGMRELGKYRLKDLNEPEHLYQLVIPDLQSDFPPLKSLEFMPNNLPVSLTSFVGREQEIREIKNLLGSARLITLTGAGGTGKTRLAIEVVKKMVAQYPDGIWMIDFVILPDPGLIFQTILTTLGLREEPKRSLMQTVTDYLRSKKLLLLFDNCEHLISTLAQVADTLLQACPQLQILATSREPLGVNGENQYYVPTLTVPPTDTELSIESLRQSEAVCVFLDRAAMVRPAFQLNKANALAVSQICQRLDGIPLAIELAAARVTGLSLEQIAARLDNRFSLLSTGNRTALKRHQTLRATIDWSYDLLSEKEKILFSRLSVFAGGWTVESATEVCLVVQIEERDVLNLLLNLTDKSLIIAENQTGETRYRFLETIREYALEKLSASGEERLVRNRHLDFLINLAEEAERKYRTAEQLFWFSVMEKERGNLHAALDYVLRSDQTETALRFIGTAFWLWFFRGPWSEGQIWVQAVLARVPDLRTHAKAKALMALGLLQFAQSDHLVAHRTLERSLSIWQELDSKWWSAFVLGFMGLTIRVQNRDAAARFFEESLRFAKETDEKWILSFSLWNIGENELYLKNLPEAQYLLNQCLELNQDLGDRMLQNEVLRALGETYEARQEYQHAVDLYKESLTIVQELHDITNISVLYFNVGRALQLAGENEKAANYFRDALLQSQKLGKKSGVLRALAGLGVVAATKGDATRAVYLLTASQLLSANPGAGFSPSESTRLWLIQHLDAVHAQLGDEQFVTISAQAQRMMLTEVVKYALDM